MLSHRAVIDVVGVCRCIVGHFRHSTIAYGRLHSIQECLGVPQHCLQQDVKTRWNSTLYMVKSIIEQKTSLAVYATETEIVTLSPTQLDLAEKILAALSPIEELIKSVSADRASVSLVIPFVKMLSKTLQKHHHDAGVRTMKSEMLKSLNRRFSSVRENQHLVIPSLLDPRFKNRFFDGSEQQAKGKEMLLYEVRKVLGETVIEIEDSESANESETNSSLAEPASKRVNREAEVTELWKSFEDILKESGSLVDSGLCKCY